MFFEVNALMCPNYQSCDFFLDRSIPYFYKVVFLFCFVFSVLSYQRCHFISEEAQDARGAVQVSSAAHPQ